MKQVVFFLTILLTNFAVHAQLTDSEKNDFWNNQIRAIIDMDVTVIDEFSDDPPGGEWGHVVGLKTAARDWTNDEYLAHLNDIFTEDLRAFLREADVSIIELWKNNGDVELAVSFLETVEENGDAIEFAIILVYRKSEGIWRLNRVLYAG